MRTWEKVKMYQNDWLIIVKEDKDKIVMRKKNNIWVHLFLLLFFEAHSWIINLMYFAYTMLNTTKIYK